MQTRRFLVCICHRHPGFFAIILLKDLDLLDRRDKIDAGLASFLMDKKRRGC
jgi:hypothetical protein